MKWLFLTLTILMVYGGLLKKRKAPQPAEITAVKTGPWHSYAKFYDHNDCIKLCPEKLIDEKKEWDGSKESYMCMFSVSKVWYGMGVSRAFNCYYKQAAEKAHFNMTYEENPKYYGFEDGAYYSLDRCLSECKENCWYEFGTTYFYCVWTSDEHYN